MHREYSKSEASRTKGRVSTNCVALYGIYAARLAAILPIEKIGGRDRDRTCDLMLAKHAVNIQINQANTTVYKIDHSAVDEKTENVWK